MCIIITEFDSLYFVRVHVTSGANCLYVTWQAPAYSICPNVFSCDQEVKVYFQCVLIIQSVAIIIFSK